MSAHETVMASVSFNQVSYQSIVDSQLQRKLSPRSCVASCLAPPNIQLLCIQLCEVSYLAPPDIQLLCTQQRRVSCMQTSREASSVASQLQEAQSLSAALEQQVVQLEAAQQEQATNASVSAEDAEGMHLQNALHVFAVPQACVSLPHANTGKH